TVICVSVSRGEVREGGGIIDAVWESFGKFSRGISRPCENICDSASACLATEPSLNDRFDSIRPRHGHRRAVHQDDSDARLHTSDSFDQLLVTKRHIERSPIKTF